jgi:hypothetical protein
MLVFYFLHPEEGSKIYLLNVFGLSLLFQKSELFIVTTVET